MSVPGGATQLTEPGATVAVPSHRLGIAVDVGLFAGALAYAIASRPGFPSYAVALWRLLLIQGMFLLARVVRARGVHVQDIVSLFVTLAPCYAVVYPIIYNFYPFALFGLGESAFQRVFAATSTATLSFWAVALLADSEDSRTRLKSRLVRGLTRLTQRAADCSIVLPLVTLLLLTALYAYHLRQVNAFSLYALRDRGLFLYATADEAWWKVKYIIVALSIFLLLHSVGMLRRIRRGGGDVPHIALALGAVVPFLYISLAVGNRREPMYVFLSAFLLALVFGGPVVRRYSLPVIGLGVAGGMVYLGLYRNVAGTGDSETVTLNVLGEFVFPYQVSLVALEPGRRVLHGYSYLQPLTLFIPHTVWPNKPSLLSERFVDEMGTRGVIGFGYTPLAEAVVNLGRTGPFALGVGVALLLFYIRRSAGRHPLVYLLVFAETLGMHRGELAAITSEVLVFGGIIWLSLVLAGPPRPPRLAMSG